MNFKKVLATVVATTMVLGSLTIASASEAVTELPTSGDITSYFADYDFTEENVTLQITFEQVTEGKNGWGFAALDTADWSANVIYINATDEAGTNTVSFTLKEIADGYADAGYDVTEDGVCINCWAPTYADYVSGITKVELVETVEDEEENDEETDDYDERDTEDLDVDDSDADAEDTEDAEESTATGVAIPAAVVVVAIVSGSAIVVSKRR